MSTYKITQSDSDIVVRIGEKQVLRYAIFENYIKLVWKRKAFAKHCYHDIWEIEDQIETKFQKQIQ